MLFVHEERPSHTFFNDCFVCKNPARSTSSYCHKTAHAVGPLDSKESYVIETCISCFDKGPDIFGKMKDFVASEYKKNTEVEEKPCACGN